MKRVHLDNDFLVHALSRRGAERQRLEQCVDDAAVDIEMSAVAWYEFCRGPRTPEQLAVAHDLLGTDGIVPFDGPLAEAAGAVFASLGRPRRRANDIAIAVTARQRSATLLTRNARDFAGIAGMTVEGVGA